VRVEQKKRRKLLKRSKHNDTGVFGKAVAEKEVLKGGDYDRSQKRKKKRDLSWQNRKKENSPSTVKNGGPFPQEKMG